MTAAGSGPRTRRHGQFRRHPGADAQLRRTRARQSRRRATRATDRPSARSGIARTCQDARARGPRLCAGGAAPHERPFLPALRALGFSGADGEIIAQAAREAPRILAACQSAAAMWVANAATVSPSADTADGRAHFTPANLVSHFHRSIEAPTTTRVLRAIFADKTHFVVHDPLPAALQFGDEGAANHTRLGGADGASGIEFFVYGRAAYDESAGVPANTRHGRRGRLPRQSPAITASTLRARCSRNSIRRSSMLAFFTTT